MAKKTFKIGECAQGGIITIETKGQSFDVIGKEWDYSAGSTKGSNQSNAKEFTRKSFNADSADSKREALFFLEDLTTAYYAEQVMKFIKDNVKFPASFW